MVSVGRRHARFSVKSVSKGAGGDGTRILPEAPLWVAANTQDQPIAFMLLTGEHMDALFVDPDVRGCGVGNC